MKVSDILLNADMQMVHKARNLHAIGWHEGYLVVRFRGRDKLYIYGPEIAENTKDRLLHVPYPDKLFTQWRDNNGWQCMKVNRAA